MNSISSPSSVAKLEAHFDRSQYNPVPSLVKTMYDNWCEQNINKKEGVELEKKHYTYDWFKVKYHQIASHKAPKFRDSVHHPLVLGVMKKYLGFLLKELSKSDSQPRKWRLFFPFPARFTGKKPNQRLCFYMGLFDGENISYQLLAEHQTTKKLQLCIGEEAFWLSQANNGTGTMHVRSLDSSDIINDQTYTLFSITDYINDLNKFKIWDLKELSNERLQNMEKYEYSGSLEEIAGPTKKVQGPAMQTPLKSGGRGKRLNNLQFENTEQKDISATQNENFNTEDPFEIGHTKAGGVFPDYTASNESAHYANDQEPSFGDFVQNLDLSTFQKLTNSVPSPWSKPPEKNNPQ